MKIKKGDTVLVTVGKDKGKKAKVLKVDAAKGTLVLEGLNIRKKHQRATQKFQGGIIEKPAALRASKVLLVCPRCAKPTRLSKNRVCRKCGETVDKEK